MLFLLLISKMGVVAVPEVYLYDLCARKVMDVARFLFLVVSLFLFYMWLTFFMMSWVGLSISRSLIGWVLITNCHLQGCATYLPYSGKFSRGRNFRDFRDQTPARENLFPRKFLPPKISCWRAEDAEQCVWAADPVNRQKNCPRTIEHR